MGLAMSETGHTVFIHDCRVLVIGANAERVVDAIRSHDGTIQIESVADHRTAAEIVTTTNPNVVFSFKEVGQTPDMLEPILRARDVRWLHLATTGVDHLPSWDESKTTVTNSAGTGGQIIAEYVLAQILARETSLVEYRHDQEQKFWSIRPRRSLEGLVLHLVGVGTIGTSIARCAKSFGMRTVGFARTRVNAPSVDEMQPITSLGSEIGKADYVSIQIPLTPDTLGLFDFSMLASMKKSAWLINVSRGGIVDEPSLKRALEEKLIGGATLDVFGSEPLDNDDPLWMCDNIVITPHMCGFTTNWEIEAASLFIENLARWRCHAPLRNVVRRGATGHSSWSDEKRSSS